MVNGNTTAGNNGSDRQVRAEAWSLRRVVTITLVVLLVIAGFYLMIRFHLVLFGLFEAIVFSTAMRPLVDWLERRGIPRPVGAAFFFLAVLAFLAGIIFLLVPLFTDQGASIANTLLKNYQDFREVLINSRSILIQRIALRLPDTIQFAPPSVQGTDPNQPLDQVAIAFNYGGLILRGIFVTLCVLLLTFYWTIDRNRILLSLLLIFPSSRRESAREFYEAIENKVGAYLRGLGIMCAAIGLLSLIAYLLIGLPYVFLLALLAGLMEAVPLIGPILGAVPAVLIALALDPSKVFWVIASTVIIQQLENNLLVPRVMDESVGVNPVVSLLAFVIFSSLFGLPGALMAIPLAAILHMIFKRTVLNPSPMEQNPPAGRDAVSLLRYEAQELIMDVRKQVREKETTLVDDPSDRVEDAIEAIVNDLDSILALAEQSETRGNGETAPA